MPRRSSSNKRPRPTITSQHPTKTEVTINVYDLLPPGRLSTLLWHLGSSLLHTGVCILSREYAYGGHTHPHTTGVYHTPPLLPPPGATFRCTILHGYTLKTPAEIEDAVRRVSDKFLGEGYNLLTRNCNHFTSALCEELIGRPAPGWLNRAASIGVAVPCVVPREWVDPPDHETAGGELLDEEEEGEAASFLQSDRRRRRLEEERGSAGGRRIDFSPPPRVVSIKDMPGRDMTAAERASVPKKKLLTM